MKVVDSHASAGMISMFRLGLAVLGIRAAGYHRQLDTEQRAARGLVLILPGIEGPSSINDGIARGLVLGGVPFAIRIRDWRQTTCWSPLHLRRMQHNLQAAAEVARELALYQAQYPDCPVHLIGHSAGAGIALFVLNSLPISFRVETIILLSAAVSRDFDVCRLVTRTRRGIWNFYSPGDLPVTGLGTLIFGTLDRRSAISSGALGFRIGRSDSAAAPGIGAADSFQESAIRDEDLQLRQLHQIRYHPSMIQLWNFGGHFGFTNTAFVARCLVPIIMRDGIRATSTDEGNNVC